MLYIYQTKIYINKRTEMDSKRSDIVSFISESIIVRYLFKSKKRI